MLSLPFISPCVGHQFKVGIPHCAYINTFVPKTSTRQDHLPTPLVSISSNDFFREALTTYFPL